MANVERKAHVVWEGDLMNGGGSFSGASGALEDLPVTWASRVERSDGKTSPEELIAAAHASCYSMALSNTLAENGYAPERLTVDATCTFDDQQLKITAVNLDVRGRVSGLSAEEFEENARQAEQGCPVSNALRNNVEIKVNASLES